MESDGPGQLRLLPTFLSASLHRHNLMADDSDPGLCKWDMDPKSFPNLIT